MRHFAQEILNFLQNLWDGGIFGPQRGRGRARPARRSARPPFNGQLPLTPRAGHARPLPRGCHRLPRRGQDPSLRTIVHGCFVGSGLDPSAGWAGVGGLARRGGIHAARDVCGGGNSAGRIYAAPTNRSEKWRLRLVCRGGIHASRAPLRRHKHPGRDKFLPYALLQTVPKNSVYGWFVGEAFMPPGNPAPPQTPREG